MSSEQTYKKSLTPCDGAVFSDWYNDIIFKADLVDQSPVKGCCIIKPYGYSVWEHIVAELDKRIKATGTKNLYLPLLIPQSFLKREKDHLEGFSPELAVVTIAGGETLAEPYVVRPTSETVVYDAFARWIKSYRDLPFKINQWANVMRWEMRTRPFLRTTEFLWQEGHTAHKDFDQAHKTMIEMLELYQKFFCEYLCLWPVVGPKPESEKFAGGHTTMTLELLMPDGKALQTGTSHLLSHDFPKVFGVQFQDSDGTIKTPWCTSWGQTTRMIGALVMAHGDAKGLVLPPKVAPIQALIIPIYKNEEQKALVIEQCQKTKNILSERGIRVEMDLDDSKSPGFKFCQSEQRGIPVRIDIGPMDCQNGGVTLVSRVDCPDFQKKTFVSLDQLAQGVDNLISAISKTLLDSHKAFVQHNTHSASSAQEVEQKLEVDKGFVKVFWCDRKECLERLKGLKATPRVVVENVTGQCVSCNQEAPGKVLVAKAY